MRCLPVFAVFIIAVTSSAWAADVELKPSEVFATDAPSIVVVNSFDKNGKAIALGSGVVISKDTVVSNCHVVEKAATASVLYRHQHFPAKLLYADVPHDLCAFTVQGLDALPVRLGSTSQVNVGDTAYAIGAPEGLELTLSGGLISSLRHIPGGVVLQMTTPISPGSSGGGLFDSQGRLIGITSYYMGNGEQLNFALPVEWIKELPKRGKLAVEKTVHVNHITNTTPELILRNGIRAVNSGDYAAALKILKPLANDGNAVAENSVGWMYKEGKGVPQDYAQAIAWFSKAAAQGNVDAQNNLGVMYESGLGVPQDNMLALVLYDKATEQGDAQAHKNSLSLVTTIRNNAAKGNAEAQFELGKLYYLGNDVSRDYAQMLTWYGKAAAQGNAKAQNNLGVMYNSGTGVAKNGAQAFAWFSKAAAQGIAVGQYNLGTMYESGIGVSKDFAQALAWYRKAAAQDYASAQTKLGLAYLWGTGVPEDSAQAIVWLSKAAAQGNVDAQGYLAFIYDNGLGVKKDYSQGFVWDSKAAAQGYAPSEYSLGDMYEHGLGVTQNYTQAIAWYGKAASQGHVASQFELGWMYQSGIGVSQDYTQAAAWYSKAASQGDADAQNNLGWMYESGFGVPQDYTQSILFYKKAAAQQDARAQVNLGLMYGNGRGVPQDLVAAYALYNLAASTQSDVQSNAISNRNQIMNTMTPAQINTGQTLTREMQRIGLVKALDAHFNVHPFIFTTTDGFSITLPASWVQIPPQILDEYFKNLSAQVPNVSNVHYDYAFQSRADSDWFSYPYVLVVINKMGKLTESQLREYSAATTNELTKVKSRLQDFSKITNDINIGDSHFDKSTLINWVSMTSNVINVGSTSETMAIIPTEFGYVQITGYTKTSENDDFLPIFKNIVNSFHANADVAYKLHSMDHYVPFDFSKDIAYAIMGVLLGLVSFLWVRKRKKIK